MDIFNQGYLTLINAWKNERRVRFEFYNTILPSGLKWMETMFNMIDGKFKVTIMELSRLYEVLRGIIRII